MPQNRPDFLSFFSQDPWINALPSMKKKNVGASLLCLSVPNLMGPVVFRIFFFLMFYIILVT